MKGVKKAKGSQPENASSAILPIQVIIEDDGSGEPVYCNFAEIVRGQFEMEIRFGRAPAKLSPEQLDTARNGSPVTIYPLTKVVLPFVVAKGLSDAILAQLAMQVEGT